MSTIPRIVVSLLLGLCFHMPVALGQAAASPPAPGNSADDAPILRFTPEMARAMAGQYTRNVLMKRYELDKAKADDATDAVARRLMATAHRIDKQGAEFVEYFMSEMITAEAEGRQQNGITGDLAKGVSQRIIPMLPVVRDLIRDVSGDVRPLLSFKQQLKLTGDVAMAGTMMNGFEQTMHRWEKGEARPFENPFDSEQPDQPIEREADGTSKRLKNAQRTATSMSNAGEWMQWKSYVEDAKKLYKFDDSQSAAAESVLREYVGRAETASKDTTYRDRLYRNRLWWSMLINLKLGWGNLLYQLLEDQQKDLSDPITKIGIEFKTRIDDIPTAAQRTAADERIAAVLREKGLSMTEPAP